MNCEECKDELEIAFYVCDMSDLANITDSWFSDYDEAIEHYENCIKDDEWGEWRLIEQGYCSRCGDFAYEEYLEAHSPEFGEV